MNRIKVIKRRDNKTVSDQTETINTRKLTAAQTVKSWISEFRTEKEVRHRRDWQAVFGTN